MASLMATGNVHAMLDNNQSFEEFMLSTAKQFGALIHMRDEPSDAPIPDKIPVSVYYAESLEKATAKVNELQAMDSAQRLTYGATLRDETIIRTKANMAQQLENVTKVRAMITSVSRWVPPTEEHNGLKETALKNLYESIRNEPSDAYSMALKSAIDKTPIEYFNEELTRQLREVECASKFSGEEIERVATRQKWLDSLRDSLKTLNT